MGFIVEALDGAGRQVLVASIYEEAMKSRYLQSP
jgi:hypothetical protein